MERIILSYPNLANICTYDGGDWLGSLPVSNLATVSMSEVARTADADLASTTFRVDIGSARLLRCFALINHNLSPSARWRVAVGSSPGTSNIYDSGMVKVWRMEFDNLFAWESVSWWTTSSPDDYYRSPFMALIVADDFYEARHITVEIDDQDNADGYIQIGRFFTGGGFQPALNPRYGVQDSWRDLSDIDQSESGELWAVERRRLRAASFFLQWLTPAETAYIHDMQRRLGTIGDVLYVPYPDDLGESQRYGFLGRLADLSAIEYPYFMQRSTGFRIEEKG